MTAGEGGAPASPDARAVTVYVIPTDAVERARIDLGSALYVARHPARTATALAVIAERIESALAELERRVSPEGGAQPK